MRTSGNLDKVREVSIETETRSSKMVIYDVSNELKTYYYIVSSVETSEDIFEKAGIGESFTYPFI